MLQLTIKLLVLILITTISLKLISLKREGSEFLNSLFFKKSLYNFVALTLVIVRIIWFINVFLDETWGKLLHAELSNFSSTVMLVGVLFKKDNIIKWILPWFLIAGALPLLFNDVWDDVNFFGTLFSYIGHAMMYFAAMLLILTVSRYSRKDFIDAYLLIFGFLMFVFVVSGIPWMVTGNIHFGVFGTGMFSASYEPQEVGNVIINHYVFLAELGPHPWGTVVFYTLATIGFAMGVGFIRSVQTRIGIQVPVLDDPSDEYKW